MNFSDLLFFLTLKCKQQIEMLVSCIEFRKNPQYLKNAETPHCATIAAFWCRQRRRQWRRRQRHCVKVREEGGFRNWFSWFFSREAAHYTTFWFHKDHFKGQFLLTAVFFFLESGAMPVLTKSRNPTIFGWGDPFHSYLTFKKPEMDKTLRDGLIMSEMDSLNHKQLDLAL